MPSWNTKEQGSHSKVGDIYWYHQMSHHTGDVWSCNGNTHTHPFCSQPTPHWFCFIPKGCIKLPIIRTPSSLFFCFFFVFVSLCTYWAWIAMPVNIRFTWDKSRVSISLKNMVWITQSWGCRVWLNVLFVSFTRIPSRICSCWYGVRLYHLLSILVRPQFLLSRMF